MNTFHILANNEKLIDFSASYTEKLDSGKICFKKKKANMVVCMTFPLLNQTNFQLVFNYKDFELSVEIDKAKQQDSMIKGLSNSIMNWNKEVNDFLVEVFTQQQDISKHAPINDELQLLNNNNVLINHEILSTVGLNLVDNEFGTYIGWVANTGAVGALIGAAFGNPVMGGLIGVGVGSVACQNHRVMYLLP